MVMPALRPGRLAAALSSILALAALGAAPAAQAGGRCRGADAVPHHGSGAQVRGATLCLLNSQRHQHHLRGLRENSRLEAAATRHSADMVAHHYFAHGNPVARMLQVGYMSMTQAWTVGENIAWGSHGISTPREIVKMWMHSPPHRANVLRSSFRDIGIGVALGAPYGGSGATYTTDFGRRG
jgi:uncharacterized protein YkwD